MFDIIFPSVSSMAIVTVLGAVFGLLLSIAMLRLRTHIDPRIEKIMEALPGANCGACGMPGCSAYATRIVEEKYRIDLCMVGGNEIVHAIARIMGVEAGAPMTAKTARVRCQGGTSETAELFIYSGLRQCSAAHGVAGGFKVCRYGCLGFGDCCRSCPFDAIHMGEEGLPVVDYEACTGCGLCVAACPRNIISLAPHTNDIHLLCSNEESAPVMKAGCSVGCIACRLCVKECVKALTAEYPERDPSQIKPAIEVDHFLTRLNYDLCIQCYRCVNVCPVPVINPVARSKRFSELNDKITRSETQKNTVGAQV